MKRKKRRALRGDAKSVLQWFFLFSAVLLLFGGVLRLVSSWQNRVWVGDTRVTFAVAGSTVKLFSYQKGRELVSVEFPQGLEVSAAQGMGEWKLESLYEVGKTRGLGGELLVKSIEYSLSLPVDGYFAGELNFFEESNFTVFDKLKIFVVLGSVRTGEQKNFEAQKLRIIKEERLADGELGWKLVPERTKDFTTREFQDAVVARENIGVGVINATQVRGAGEEIAGIIRTMGSQVVWLRGSKDAPHTQAGCLLRVRERTTTSEKLARVFSCEVEVEKEKLSAPIEFTIVQKLAEELP